MESIAAIDIYIYADSLFRNHETPRRSKMSCSAICALTFPTSIIECLLCCIKSSFSKKTGLSADRLNDALIGFSHAAFLSITCLEQIRQVLRKAGMGCKMLQCFQSICDTDIARAHTQSDLSHALQYTNGVKQGCPMSPNLFGLYMDDLQELRV